MKYLTREETARYLLDYSNLFNKIKEYPNMSVIYILGTYIRPDLEPSELEDYFNKIKNVHNLTNVIRVLNFFEETFSVDIENDDIEIDEIKDIIFNVKNQNEYTNSEILRRIRNVISHNDNTDSYYHISKDATTVHIKIEDTRRQRAIRNDPNNPRPFDITIKAGALQGLVMKYMNSYKNFIINFIPDIDLVPEDRSLDFIDNLKYYKYDFTGKIDDEDRNNLTNLINNSKLSKEMKLSTLESYCNDKNNDITLDKKEYSLTKEQKESLKLYYKNRSQNADVNTKTTLFELHLLKTYPYYCSKVYDIADEMVLLDSIKLLYNASHIMESMLDETNIKNEDHTASLNMLYTLENLFINGIGINALTYIVNNLNLENELMKNLNHLNPKEKIINNNVNNNYNFAQHLRNALTHGWYFFNANGNLEIYDNHKRKDDDYNFYYHASVNYKNLEKEINQIVNNKTLSNTKIPVMNKLK